MQMENAFTINNFVRKNIFEKYKHLFFRSDRKWEINYIGLYTLFWGTRLHRTIL